MYPIDLVQYTDTRKKIPTSILTNAAVVYPENKSTLFKSYFQDGVMVLWASNLLASMMILQMSSFFVTPAKMYLFKNLPILSFNMMMFAPLLGCLYYAFSYHLNHGQTFGLFKNKKKVHFESFSWRKFARWSLFSTVMGMTLGLPMLSSRFVAWTEKTMGFSFKPHDDLYCELFVPKNEWAPVLMDMIPPEMPQEIYEENYFKAA